MRRRTAAAPDLLDGQRSSCKYESDVIFQDHCRRRRRRPAPQTRCQAARARQLTLCRQTIEPRLISLRCDSDRQPGFRFPYGPGSGPGGLRICSGWQPAAAMAGEESPSRQARHATRDLESRCHPSLSAYGVGCQNGSLGAEIPQRPIHWQTWPAGWSQPTGI